jgi:hypothetical protein
MVAVIAEQKRLIHHLQIVKVIIQQLIMLDTSWGYRMQNWETAISEMTPMTPRIFKGSTMTTV